jgi:hypothetical protein
MSQERDRSVARRPTAENDPLRRIWRAYGTPDTGSSRPREPGGSRSLWMPVQLASRGGTWPGQLRGEQEAFPGPEVSAAGGGEKPARSEDRGRISVQRQRSPGRGSAQAVCPTVVTTDARGSGTRWTPPGQDCSPGCASCYPQAAGRALLGQASNGGLMTNLFFLHPWRGQQVKEVAAIEYNRATRVLHRVAFVA